MPRFRRGHLSDRPHRHEEDPFAKILAPPTDETIEEREKRLAAEAEAQKRSDAIDEEINRQRMAERREPKHIRILLLGQSESGKSTTLKNFQLMNSPKAFRNERASWRAVIQLNVVRSIRLILNLMSEVSASSGNGRSTPTSMMATSRPGSPSADQFDSGVVLGPELLKLKMRLAPLQQVEESLLRKLSPPGSTDFEATHLAPVTNLPYAVRSGKFTREIAVHSNSQWKGAFSRLMTSVRTSIGSEIDLTEDPNDPGVILNACADDMIKLWNHPIIKTLLLAHNLRLEDKAGFFLDSLERVTSLRYMPTDDDILRARLKTLGVSEHRFKFKNTATIGESLTLAEPVHYEVRAPSTSNPTISLNVMCSYLAAWAPYFDNMDAIIFLAPLSGFDEALAEDPNTNRLEDSVLLWKATISNPLLKTAQTVLFLNKMDIFKAKLESGIKFGDYVVSYGDRPNDPDTAAAYLRKKFAGIHKQHSPIPRMLYSHMTAVTDVKSTQAILTNVKDMVLRQALENTKLV
ncbi:guanine nucleotide-binding protein alpha-4 subunit [Coprinopsis cinerea okayama7|uniref:Guanine nucleotide-binding protein alpha-4 subunit n=1 Tax=Coprinopsis cinerea (strain Okayama-7 / 130 / ATCC MYA-4618 / FGSC 9003) TaxID=240176 RepID=A8N6C9_COPC7|nr:guanine nucleotide-binding protein alpha-4 subunit [Coprinopsis cinerea okayama7\|eukprot:XP_001830398.2 guanine nucleotide-binding protein alpha-4 subunit [Coprinopsis cinerea okayama7\